jgi:imidazolonepropionase
MSVLTLFRDMTEEAATKAIINDQLPAVSRAIRLGEISVDNIDVFCEKGVFELEASQQILEAGRAMGLRMNFHADEIYPLGGAEVLFHKTRSSVLFLLLSLTL